jgi:hypothetical protein
MKVKTNIRAGKGGASGSGQNSKGQPDVPEVEIEDPVPVYVPPVSRCTGA